MENEEEYDVFAINLSAFMEATLDLMESIREDIKAKGYISEDTLHCLRETEEKYMSMYDTPENGRLH